MQNTSHIKALLRGICGTWSNCSSLISTAIKGNSEGVKKAESFQKDDHLAGYMWQESGVTLLEIISHSLESQGQLSVAMCKSDMLLLLLSCFSRV